ncbi:hypothetical protein BDK51DRAFT_39914 [Blyttiomyces helicus]|uniref:Uncharacterized protein n=1 Tax=Blyttiomyces helicus TaxID=388810 RepID=A0A4P9WLM4_9FUNG|nr:hypothetical protein BDK51DRAFT_39914 [Blyttiomyces helicus]|eukprot:RKO92528.1 hypothetical protein BDK51DRAFT_39914 [Blyttiomyces helicus]
MALYGAASGFATAASLLLDPALLKSLDYALYRCYLDHCRIKRHLHLRGDYFTEVRRTYTEEQFPWQFHMNWELFLRNMEALKHRRRDLGHLWYCSTGAALVRLDGASVGLCL